MRRRALARGDRHFEVVATQGLGFIAQRKGDVVRAAALYESVLPLIERERNPEMYANLRGQLGDALIALGEFDRALMLHSEALELFAARGDDSRTARELSALAAIQFRTGNLERALATIESAMPLYQRSRDPAGHAAALRLAGNAAAELGRHDLALDYLHDAERLDRNGVNIERTRVLIAGELRTLGDLAGAGKLLEQVLPRRRFDASRCAVGACALAPGAKPPARGARRSARGRCQLRATQAGFQPHRLELGTGAGAARRRPFR